MFSMPLAYPSTLDRRPAAARLRRGRRPTWRSFGARSSRSVPENRRLKQTLITSAYFRRTNAEIFLSLAGPRFGLALVQVGHHLGSYVDSITFGDEKGDPLGRPRLARYAARDLARMPPSEGRDITGLVVGVEAKPARLTRRNSRRADEDRWVCVCVRHRPKVGSQPRIAKTPAKRKRSNQRSTDRRQIARK